MKAKQLYRWCMVAVVTGMGLGLASCGSPAKVVDSTDGLVTVNEINIQDFEQAASTLTTKMLASKNFQDELQQIKQGRPGGTKPLVFISKIKNNTRQHANVNSFLVTKIEEALQESGKVEFFTSDENSRKTASANEILNNGQPALPDLTLYGIVDELPVVAGNMRQNTYIFHMRLAGSRATTIWQGQEQVTKRGTRPGLGS